AECLRVSRRGAVWTCPAGAPAVAEAERLAAAAYAARNGQPHPFLSEHALFGPPTEAEMKGHLDALGVPFAVFAQAPLASWLAALRLTEPRAERSAWGPASRLTARVEARAAPPGPAYRRVYVAARAAEAEAALRGVPPCCSPWSDASADAIGDAL